MLVIHIINKAACVGSKHDDQDNDKMNTLAFNHLFARQNFFQPRIFQCQNFIPCDNNCLHCVAKH